MTERAKRQDGDQAREEYEGLAAETVSQELAPERDAQCDLTGAATEATEAPDAAQPTSAPERARARRAARKTPVARASETEAAGNEATDVVAMSAIEADRIELEAQGFSAEEAERLIDVSKRLETSAEALASQAELKRLRFAQWLVERGILDEFRA
ncbi:MAG TPA: hypothetical protein VIC27_01215 [Ktedonobacterales bacterium]|jgi:hypothetical protein